MLARCRLMVASARRELHAAPWCAGGRLRLRVSLVTVARPIVVGLLRLAGRLKGHFRGRGGEVDGRTAEPDRLL